ncbi:MerR family transcriptional regulator [Sphingomonas panni]
MPQHRLRYWEGRFPQIKPLTRAGDRRHYRPTDVALLRRIHSLLGEQGYTVRGVQQLLAQEAKAPLPVAPAPAALRASPNFAPSARFCPMRWRWMGWDGSPIVRSSAPRRRGSIAATSSRSSASVSAYGFPPSRE